MVSRIRGYWRLIVFFTIVIQQLLKAAWQNLVADKSDPNFAYYLVEEWAWRSKRALNIKVDVQGEVPKDGAMIMPNHRSYIDPVPLIICIKACYVAKKEVESWPLISQGAKVARTIFVNRKDKDSRKQTRVAVRSRLEEGISTCVFPEGTTYRAPVLGRLHTGIFQTAVEGGFPVVPVALEYADPADAWIGKDLFILHFLQCFRKKETYVKIRFGPVMQVDDPTELVGMVRDWLTENLAELRQEFADEGGVTMQELIAKEGQEVA